MNDRPQWQRDALRRALMLGVLALVGLSIQIAFDGMVGIAGTAILGLAGVLFAGLVFYEIGLSEDRERSGQ